MIPPADRRGDAFEEDGDELYEGAPCGYLSTTPDGTIVKVNRTFLEWTGYRREDLLQKRFHELLTPGGRIYHETHYAPLLQMQGAVREIAVDIVRADGTRLPALVNSVQKRDDHGRPLVIRTTVFDATARKKYERELLHARERERSARERVERLQAVTARLAAALEPQAVARTVVEAVVADLEATAASFAVRREQPDRLHELHRHGRLAGPAIDAPPPDARFSSPAAPNLPARGVVPLITPAGPAGVLTVEVAGRALDGDEQTFVVACASQAAQALERVRLHQETRDVANALQRSMLALELPRDERFSLATCYLPAVETLDVGGDWYDAFVLDERRLGLVVGDVVGRGLAAATAMGQLRSAVRALALAGIGPAAVIERLDRFVGRLEPGQMATLAYCEVDLDDGLASYACAGHPPPAVVLPDGPATLLWEGRSAPLAAHVGPGPRAQAETHMPAGARLLLYSDGLVERRRSPIDTGLARLLEELEARRSSPLEALVRQLADALLTEPAGSDDVCLLCADFRPSGGNG